jgi:hypothetical protein
MSVLPLVLKSDFELESIVKFFEEENGATHHDDPGTHSIGWKICDPDLHSYSEKSMLYKD